VTDLRELAPGLWRWTAPHPEWTRGAAPESPGDWPRDVGSVLCETDGTRALIDPLLPLDREPFLRELDRRVRGRGVRVAVLTTIGFHRRSRDELARRYGASTSRARRELPDGIEAFPIRGAGETMFWLARQRALVPGDRLLGDDGGLRLCPESWLRYLRSGLTLEGLRERLGPLLELPIERVVVSHGEPVLAGGREALAEALRFPTD
jgi:hypothetical protein